MSSTSDNTLRVLTSFILHLETPPSLDAKEEMPYSHPWRSDMTDSFHWSCLLSVLSQGRAPSLKNQTKAILVSFTILDYSVLWIIKCWHGDKGRFFWNLVKVWIVKTGVGRFSARGQEPCEPDTRKCRIKYMNPVPSPRCLRKDCQKYLRYSELERERAPKGSPKANFCKAKNTFHNLTSPRWQGWKLLHPNEKYKKLYNFSTTNNLEWMDVQPLTIYVRKYTFMLGGGPGWYRKRESWGCPCWLRRRDRNKFSLWHS